MRRQIIWQVDNVDQALLGSRLCKIVQILGIVHEDHVAPILPLIKKYLKPRKERTQAIAPKKEP